MITLTKLLTLAAADAINPCALAVMSMVLVAILTSNPEKKHKVLFGGLAFTFAVFVGYFFYGVVIVQVFHGFINVTSGFYFYLKNGLACLAILLGVMNIKDFIKYVPGGIATEMPLGLRPRVKQIIKGITSVPGAFLIGIFVTLFLLPCTIGPYVVFSGLISEIGLMASVPWLLLYNLIFVLPMIAITFMVYFGVWTTEKVGGWKDKNIKRIHLITGILLVAIGVLILTNYI